MPQLTVLLPAPGGLDSIRAVLDVWVEQASGDRVELMVLCPYTASNQSSARGLRLVDSTGLDLYEARAAGIRAARGEYVMIGEDHCVPDTEWTERVCERLDEGWDVVVPSLRPAGPRTAAAQAAFLLGYGQWLPPLATGSVRALPGHNLVVSRRLLLRLGPELDELLVVSAFLGRRLERSARVCLEPMASMRHVDQPGLRANLRVFGAVGVSFGAVRTRSWPWLGRALYAFSFLPIAVAHWRRAAVHYRRAGHGAGIERRALVAAAALASAWGCGEALGALLGPRRVAPYAMVSEIKPITASRRATRVEPETGHGGKR